MKNTVAWYLIKKKNLGKADKNILTIICDLNLW